MGDNGVGNSDVGDRDVDYNLDDAVDYGYCVVDENGEIGHRQRLPKYFIGQKGQCLGQSERCFSQGDRCLGQSGRCNIGCFCFQKQLMSYGRKQLM